MRRDFAAFVFPEGCLDAQSKVYAPQPLVPTIPSAVRPANDRL